MDTDPEEHFSYIQKYADQHLRKREELLAVIKEHNRRIDRIFLFDRCMSAAVLFASLAMLWGLGIGNRRMAFFSGLAVLCASVIHVLFGIHRALDVAAENKRGLERQLENMDQAWRQWSTS